MSVKDWRPGGTHKGDLNIRRVGGAQAQMVLEDLGLVKVDAASAVILFGADIPFVIAPSKINSYHFFGGWNLAARVDPVRTKKEDWTFRQMLNNWNYYNENSENGKAAFFVERSLIT
jgi:hypothetical protein